MTLPRRHPSTRPRGSTGPAPWGLTALKALILVVAVCAVYSPVRSAGFVWDDDEYVVRNANLDDLAGLERIWREPRSSPQYYPLVFSSFWLERRLFGAGAAAPHAVNVCLHLLSAGLLWGILGRLRVRGAYVAALVFAVHPVHVESVAWITERKNVLSAACYLASAWTFLAWAGVDREEPAGAARRRRPWLYAASLVLFTGALLSKTVTATLPAALALVIWWKRGRLGPKEALALAPFAAAGALMGGLTAWLEVHHVGAAGGEWTPSAPARVLLAARVAWFYASSLVWPHPLAFVYPRWVIDAGSAWAYVPLLAALACAAALWHWRRGLGRGPATAVLFFLVTLFPAMGFFSVYPMRYAYVADHFQYLASTGLIALLVACGAGLAARAAADRRVVSAAAGVVVVALALAARAGTARFHDVEALWTDTLARNPGAWLALNNLGNLRVSQGRYAEARELFERAIGERPDLAEAHNNLGTAWFREGRLEDATRAHRRAVELDPAYADARNNLGVDLANTGDLPQAIAQYEAALRLNRRSVAARYNLANALVRVGRAREAEALYREACRLDPSAALPRFYLGYHLLTTGRAAEAGPLLDEAFRRAPGFAQGFYQVGTTCLQQGRFDAAAEWLRRAIAARPGHAESHNNLGSALLHQGRLDEAVAEFLEAVRLAPGHAGAHNNLGYAREAQGRVADAEAAYREALRLAPDDPLASANLARLTARER